MMPGDEVAPDWDRVRPVLDEAMAELSEADRDALLMRFFKNHDFRTVGAGFGISANAAQQRVIRALDRLRESLAHRGITTTGAALSVILPAHAVQTAPVGLAATLSAAALTAGSAVHTSIAVTATKTIAMTTLQKSLVTFVVAATLGTSLYATRKASNLGAEVQANEASLELLRLRREVGVLRQRTNELAKGASGAASMARPGQRAGDESPDSSTPINFSRDSWKPAGLATPENALISFMWAKSQGDVKTAFSTATPEMAQSLRDSYFKDKSEEEISAMLIESAKNQTGIQVLKKLAAAEDQVVFQVHVEGTPEKAYSLLTLQRTGGEWKVSSAEERANQP